MSLGLSRLDALVALTASIAVLLPGVLPSSTALVEADHFDGNMTNSVNYWLVQPDQIRVCDLGTLATPEQIDAAPLNGLPPFFGPIIMTVPPGPSAL